MIFSIYYVGILVCTGQNQLREGIPRLPKWNCWRGGWQLAVPQRKDLWLFVTLYHFGSSQSNSKTWHGDSTPWWQVAGHWKCFRDVSEGLGRLAAREDGRRISGLGGSSVHASWVLAFLWASLNLGSSLHWLVRKYSHSMGWKWLESFPIMPWFL